MAIVYDYTGKKLSSKTLPKEVFGQDVNQKLLAQALHVYRFNQSQKTSKVKSRGEVSLTTAKAYRQKGTGNARHGAKSAPIFVGGGVAHGPKGIKPQSKRLNKKMRTRSFISALSALSKDNSINLIKGLDKIKSKTSDLEKALKKLDMNKKTLILTNETYPNLLKASKNLQNLTVSRFNLTSIYQLLNTKNLLIDENALSPLILWLTGKKLTSKTTTKKSTKK